MPGGERDSKAKKNGSQERSNLYKSLIEWSIRRVVTSVRFIGEGLSKKQTLCCNDRDMLTYSL